MSEQTWIWGGAERDKFDSTRRYLSEADHAEALRQARAAAFTEAIEAVRGMAPGLVMYRSGPFVPSNLPVLTDDPDSLPHGLVQAIAINVIERLIKGDSDE
jgi:hypothetical protein